MPNIREALEFSLSDDGQAALAIVAALQPFWMCRRMLREPRQWTDYALARAPREPTRDRVRALFSAALVAPLHGDLSVGAARAAEARALAAKLDDPVTHAVVAMADGITAIVSGDFNGAAAHLKDALRASNDDTLRPRRLPVARGADFFRLSSRYCRGSTRRECRQNLARMPAKGGSVTAKSIFTLLLSSGGSIDLGSSSVSPAQGTGVRGRADQGPSASPSGRGRRPR